jgi:two-component system CheB/CheR fusion protein
MCGTAPRRRRGCRQASRSGKPVLLRLDAQAGHGIGSTASQADAQQADIQAFLLWQVIPPNKDIATRGHQLVLVEPSQPRGHRLPVDTFFTALAQSHGNLAMGVILSGMGADGTAGMLAIHEHGGYTLAQDPATAPSPGMPRSAVDAGVVDTIDLAESLPARLLDYVAHALGNPAGRVAAGPVPSGALYQLLELLRAHTGNDFSLYKVSTLLRRIERRTRLLQLASLADYVHYLQSNPQEIDLLFKEVLIGVTSFFRDPQVWNALQRDALPGLLASHPAGQPLRAWVPACSTGEEAYTLAMLLREAIAALQPPRAIQVTLYATDIDADSIDQARKGTYPASIVQTVGAERLARHFVREDGHYRVRKEVRETVVFAVQNILSDPPFTRLDILTCRNLLIYFRAELQKKLFPLFHYALHDRGLLVLGSAESIGNFGHLFAPLDSKARLFHRLSPAARPSALQMPAPSPKASLALTAPPSPMQLPENLGQLTDQLIQQHYAPAAVLVNAEGDILYISGRTGRYLEPAAGKFNLNIHAMAREGLREALPGVIQKALREPLPVQLAGLKVQTDHGIQVVNVTVDALHRTDALAGRVLLVFHDVATPRRRRRNSPSVDVQAHEAVVQELQQTREALQVTNEEMQASVEELKSANEELQSTNEEIQSTNEELTTAREEMQSMNEELQTVNTELQSKVTTLLGIQNDMANLLNSTEIAAVFLDRDMALRRFTPHATNLFRLIPGDVGRPLAHVANDLQYPGLMDDARQVLQTLESRENQVGASDGRWFRVRVMPYRTHDHVIDGVVITFIDTSDIHHLQSEVARLSA